MTDVMFQRYGGDCDRILIEGKIVGFLKRYSDASWGIFDSNHKALLGGQSFKTLTDSKINARLLFRQRQKDQA